MGRKMTAIDRRKWSDRRMDYAQAVAVRDAHGTTATHPARYCEVCHMMVVDEHEHGNTAGRA